jgi:hypothetical protein
MRKPVHKLRPDETREAVWAKIREMKIFSVTDLWMATRCSRDAIRDYLKGLTNADYVEFTAPTALFKGGYYKLIKDTGMEAPRVRRDGTPVTMGKGREQIWRALGIFAQKARRFTFRDLTLNASTQESPVAESDVKHYLGFLAAANYLIVVEEGCPGKPARYLMFTRNWTGPRPPQVQRINQLYDPNKKKVVWSEDGGAE